jgi:hypothetical protein
MYTDALLTSTTRGEELSYVTRHFRDLQGMRMAPAWAALLLLAIVSASIGLSRGHVAGVGILIIALFFAVWLPWSGAWYKRHYGLVANLAPQYVPGLSWAMIAFLVVFVGTGIFGRLDAYRGVLNMWICLLFTLPVCFYPAPASIPIRLRRALYIVGTLAIFSTIGSVPFLHESKWLLLAVITATLLLLNLYDHWLLNQLLTRNQPESSHD